MRMDLDEMERDLKGRIRRGEADIAVGPEDALALIARIREIETLGAEALNRLATATVALKAEGVLTSTEAAAEVAWIRERHATIAKGTCTP